MKTTKIEEFASDLKEYASIQYELTLLKAIDKTSTVSAKIWSIYILAMVFFLVIAFVGAAGGYALSKVTGSVASGLLIVAGIYFVIGLILVMFRNSALVSPIRNSIIKQLFNHGK